MTEEAKQFLLELSKDPVKMEEFWKDPDTLLATTNLTAEEKDVLRSGDPERLKEFLDLAKWNFIIPTPIPHKPGPHGPEKPKN